MGFHKLRVQIKKIATRGLSNPCSTSTKHGTILLHGDHRTCSWETTHWSTNIYIYIYNWTLHRAYSTILNCVHFARSNISFLSSSLLSFQFHYHFCFSNLLRQCMCLPILSLSLTLISIGGHTVFSYHNWISISCPSSIYIYILVGLLYFFF